MQINLQCKIARNLLLATIITLFIAAAAQAQTLLRPPPSTEPAAAPAPAAPAATPAPADTSAPPKKDDTTFLNLLTRGGWAMWPLALCSLIGLALIIERGLALRRNQIIPAGFLEGLKRTYHGREDTELAITYCQKNPSSIGRIMAAGLRKIPEGTQVTEQAIADQGATEIARLRRNLRMLHGIAAITPTLGLLGTVTGMIRAFEVASSVGLGHSELLMKGIYEALVATMTGLMIAVPVLFFYYLYLGIIDRTVLDLNDSAQAFMEKFDRGPASIEREAAVQNDKVL